ncbi:MAG TPA: hypothetical protein VN837_20635 [Chloroflexota bacterium]|nr:hypothetical protein [Chloroflexota bacterium]
MMNVPRLVGAILLALVLTVLVCGGRARGSGPALRILHDGRPVGILIPGATVEAVATGLDGRRERYCLGLASLGDRYGVPVTLASFHPVDDGVMVAKARVPLHVFPAEPTGPFLMYAGSCTDVAPLGNVAGARVRIEAAVG